MPKLSRPFVVVSAALVMVAATAALPLACDEGVRPLAAEEPTYRDDVAAILDAKCARCHANDAPAAGYRTNGYAGAIGCTAAGKVAVLPADAAPLLLVLARPDHRDFVTGDELAKLTRWVATGAQSVRAGVHPRSFADPRSASGHAAQLRATRYRALTDPGGDTNACTQCHDGAGPRPSDVIAAAPGATSCTTCHTDNGGVIACTTCHGAPGRPFPPRDPCFYPSETKNDVHAAHAAKSPARATGLDCAACHPRPVFGALDGAHTDGYVEVWFDGKTSGREAQWDSASRRCTGTCHDRGGTQPSPAWSAGNAPLDCNSCHTSPPKDHFTGPCSGCHKEANATGTALVAPLLHVNGKVDLGDGSGGCGACHGSGNSPWPSTGAHPAHQAPAGAAPVACETCHAVPGPNDGHPRSAGAAVIRLAGLATRGGRAASYDPATKSCAATYCHDGPGASAVGRAPRWTDGAPARACGSCHSTPPPPPHAQLTACGLSSCHQGITDATGLTITAAGRTVHVNGVVDRAVP